MGRHRVISSLLVARNAQHKRSGSACDRITRSLLLVELPLLKDTNTPLTHFLCTTSGGWGAGEDARERRPLHFTHRNLLSHRPPILLHACPLPAAPFPIFPKENQTRTAKHSKKTTIFSCLFTTFFYDTNPLPFFYDPKP